MEDKCNPFEGITNKKYIINRILLWKNEINEIKGFLNYVNGSPLNFICKKTISIRGMGESGLFSRELALSDEMTTLLYGFLKDKIKHLQRLIDNSPEEERNIAEMIFNGELKGE